MTAPSGWQFAVEIHPSAWRFPAGSSWVAGWIYPGENHFITDLRAWIDGRAYLGLSGLPKPGLDEKFLGRAGPPYSGFAFRVEPHQGARLLRLEARDPAGCWREFFRADITTDDQARPFPPFPALSGRLQDLTLTVLRLHAQRPHSPWPVLADEVVSAALAEPLNSLPVPPFHGALEEPRDRGRLRYGRLAVTGWLAHRTAKIKGITALVDALQESILLHGLPREDISDVFTDLPGHERSQFVGHVDLPMNQSAPVLLKVFAELENGEKHLAFAQRFIPEVIAGADVPLPPLSRATFARAVWALGGAARRYGMPLGSAREFLSGIKTAWANFRAEAPPKTKHRMDRDHPSSPELWKKGRTRSARAGDAALHQPLRVLVATHNLNLEGAPWFIFELARHLAAQPGVNVRVVSPQDGPMRRVFTDAGMSVEVLDLTAAFRTGSVGEFHAVLQSAAKIAWSNIDLVIANTMVSFWAVHLAQAAGKPSLLYVHESATIRRFFQPMMKPALFPSIEAAFRLATRVVFTADASRQVFDYLNDRGNFVLLPSWVDVARIDAFTATHDKATLRRKHGLDPDAALLVNIGSVCERKGQHIFIRTIELLKEELRFTYPGEKIQFVMVGTRPGLYLDTLKQEAALHGLDNVVFLPESGEIHDFYRLADIFVCTSFEESFPRVLMESAAFRLPIVTTNVNGIPEMLAADEAWLIPPGDRHQLGDAIKQALAAHFAGDFRRAEKARTSIVRRFHEANSLPRHHALAREVVADPHS
jgi:glycosyltransferase involved in cell wall biosynthesis